MSNYDVEIDFSNTEADQFTLVKPGKYNVTIDEVTLRQAEPSEVNPTPAPYLNLRLRIADEGEYHNRMLFTVASFSEKALARTKTFLQSLGIDVTGTVGIELGDENEQGHPVVLTPNLVGEPAVATVKIEPDRLTKEDRNRVVRLVGNVQGTSAGAAVSVASGVSGSVKRFS